MDGRNLDGATPLISAAFLGRSEALEYLLAQGADRTLQNLKGEDAEAAARVPREVTQMIAELPGMEVERAAVEAGRLRCLERLAEDGSAEEKGPR